MLMNDTFFSPRFNVLTLALGFILAMNGSTRSEEPGSWPQWRGPNRDGLSAATGLLKSWEGNAPKLVWMKEGMGGGYASVSIADGLIFTTGNMADGQAVTAVNQKNGEPAWTTLITDQVPKHGYQGSRSTPTYDSGRVYAVASSGRIVCLDAKTGQEQWAREFSDWNGKMMSGWGFSESPLVDGDWVLCTPGGNDAILVALDKKTGEEVWTSAIGEFGDGKNKNDQGVRQGAAYSSIVVSEGAGVKQYIQLVGQGVIGVRAKDGQFLWGYEEASNPTANISTPVVSGDYVFTSTGYGTGSALLKLSPAGSGVTAEEIYFLDAKTFQNHHGGLILLDGHIYSGHKHNNGFPICVEMKTGKIVWGGNERGPGKGSAAVTYADGNLVFRYQDGVVALIEARPDGYRLKGQFTPEFQERESWAHPVILDGMLYLREQDKLMCYDLRG